MTASTLRALAESGARSVTAPPGLATAVLARRRRQRSRRRSGFVALAGIALVGGTVAARSVGHSRYLSVYEPNASMGTTVAEGEHLIVDRTLRPGHGDLVQMTYSAGGVRGTTIRRVIGLPGDTIACPAGPDGRCHAWTLNAVPLSEPYVLGDDSAVVAPVTVGSGQMYVLGDRRDLAVDSRWWGGPVPLTAVIGVGVEVQDAHGRARAIPGAPTHARPGQVNIDPPTVPTTEAVPG